MTIAEYREWLALEARAETWLARRQARKMWVIWSEEHEAWWRPGEMGYTRSLAEAGRYSEKRAREIETKANEFLDGRTFNEMAMPDPLWTRLTEALTRLAPSISSIKIR